MQKVHLYAALGVAALVIYHNPNLLSSINQNIDNGYKTYEQPKQSNRRVSRSSRKEHEHSEPSRKERKEQKRVERHTVDHSQHSRKKRKKGKVGNFAKYIAGNMMKYSREWIHTGEYISNGTHTVFIGSGENKVYIVGSDEPLTLAESQRIYRAFKRRRWKN